MLITEEENENQQSWVTIVPLSRHLTLDRTLGSSDVNLSKD